MSVSLNIDTNQVYLNIPDPPAINLNISTPVVSLHIACYSTQAASTGYVSPTPISVVDGTTFVIPAGKKLDSITAIPAAGARTLSVGYSAGAGEVIDAEEIPSNDETSFPIGRRYNAGKTLHFSDYIGQIVIYLL